MTTNLELLLNKKFSSKKYGDYPVIVDNEDDIELTLDSVTGILNEYEFRSKLDMKEQHSLHRQIEYVISEKGKMQSQRDQLILLIIVMVLIIIIETFLILLGVV